METELAESRQGKLALWPLKKFLGDITRKETIKVGELEEEVFLFEESNLSGLTLFNGKILLNKKLLRKENEDAKDLVFLHEKRHQAQDQWWSWLGGWVQTLFLSPPGLVLGSLTGLFLLGSLASSTLPNLWITGRPLRDLAVLTSVYLISAAFSYITELDADFYAIDRIGAERFKEATDQLEKAFANKTALKETLEYISHPPDRLTEKLYRRLRSA